MRDDFSASVKTTLAGRAGWKCSFPNCPISTAGPSSESHGKWIRNGIAAHITAAAQGGPRYDPMLTSEQRRDISNAIWMCPTHGSLIDKNETADTETEIRRWKEEAESRARNEMEHGFSRGSSESRQLLYSLKDIRILDDYSKVLPFEKIQLIRGELFGSVVRHEVINPLHQILSMEDDPKFHFQNDELEKLRRELNARVKNFFGHFSQQSAGLPSHYEYINMSELTWRDPANRSYWEQQISTAQDLARELCDIALRLLTIRENNS